MRRLLTVLLLTGFVSTTSATLKALSSSTVDCAGLYFTKSSCDAHNNCFWNSKTSVCLPFAAGTDCGREYTTQETCVNNPKCQWAGDYHRCEAIPCSGIYNQATCNSTTRCFWDVSSVRCRNFASADCNQSKTEAVCDQSPNCEWLGGQCSALPCPNLYFSKDACNNHTRCAWHNKSSICERFAAGTDCKKVYTDQSSCINNPKCQWSGDYNECGPIPCGGIYSQGICNATTRCFWDKTATKCRNFVSEDCGTYKNQNACADISNCYWLGTQCVATPCGNLFFNQGSCDAHTRCSWHNRSSSCQTFAAGTDCKKEYTDQSSCINNPKCQWLGDFHTCEATPCSGFYTESKCSDTTRCFWDKSSHACMNFVSADCKLSKTENACNDYSNCYWSGGQCEATPCGNLFFNQGSCDSHTRCAWHNKSATCQRFASGTDCKKEYDTQTACAMNPKCQWSEGNSQCGPLPCSFIYTEGKCNATTRCFWDTSSRACMNFVSTDCSTYMNQGNCNDISNCYWLNGQCYTTPCGNLFFNQGSCDAHTRCAWHNKSSTCQSFAATTDCAREYTTSTACSSNPKCQWDGSCLAKPCNQFYTKLQCGSRQQCQWHASSSSCSTVSNF